MMKFKLAYCILCLFSLTVYSQIDSQKKSTPIPAIESKKDSSIVIFPKETKENNSFNGLTVPKTNTDFSIPKKEFSMFGETFGNPGELYEKRLSKKEEELRPEGYGENAGLREDAIWGDYKTKSKYINIACRDFGLVDGDLLKIIVDDEIVQPRVYLTESFKGFRLPLKEGFNKIDFYAINEGSLIPNTAEYMIVDEWNNVISSKVWALSANVKVTIIIVKE